MKNVSLLLGLHSHQPVDNFDYVVKRAINECYYPFFSTLDNFRDLKISMHFSGWLLNFIRQNSSLFDLMQDLAKTGTIEFLTGGYYEPILCAIPSKYRKKQIIKLSEFLHKYFNQTPTGLWLTERVWDNSILKDLVDLNIEYALVDDYHFLQSGIAQERLFGYFNTSEENKILKLFPINEHLRYTIPFESVQNIQNYLENMAKNSLKGAIIFDDGEKFGMWPGTKEWVYDKGWLKEFFSMLKTSAIIKTEHYSSFARNNKPQEFVYLKENSYMEMGEWSLDANRAERFEKASLSLKSKEFIKGGNWKDFLLKYYEANKIHKRSLSLLSLEDENNKDLEDLIMRTQVNDCLWHGVFGGLYLPNLRDVFYSYVYKAENLQNIPNGVQLLDYNQDGYLEARLDSTDLVVIFDSKLGGQLIELGIKQKAQNLQNTLTRKKEFYHKNFILKQENNSQDLISTIHKDSHFVSQEIMDELIFDWYIKNSFVDHFSDESFNIDSFYHTNFKEYGDFTSQDFKLIKNENKVSFIRKSNVYLPLGIFATDLVKTFELSQNKLAFSYDILSLYKDDLRYVMEFNFHFFDYENIFINDEKLDQKLELKNVEKLVILDKTMRNKIILETNQNFDIYAFGLKTITQSEQGVDFTLQNVSLALSFRFNSSLKISGVLETSCV